MRRGITTLASFLALAAPLAVPLGAQTGTAGTVPIPGTQQQVAAAQRPEADVFLAALRALSTTSLTEHTDSALWEAGLQGMIESLQDPYASVFTPTEAAAWDEETSGNYSGIGLQITLLNEEVTVTAVFRSTPANDVGIQVGDVIVGVNAHDARGWNTDMAADSIRGPVGTLVEVHIKRDGIDDPISFDITRAEVHVPAVSYGVMKGNVGYALLDRVARNAAREMDEALRALRGTRGLIIDLRRNPGGFLDESLMLADLFLKPGSTLASTSQRAMGGETSELESESYQDQWPARVPDLPVIVLVDEYTASGAEIFAGALQDYDRALIMGERSFGKGLVQTVRPLPYGRLLRFTTGEWQTPLGRSLHRPRDMEMRPMAEDLDTFPRVTTPAGRSLLNAGGVFPDLDVQEDTLTLADRAMLRAAAENEVPLGIRLTEFAFQIAKERREADLPPALDPARFDGFVDQLIELGIPADVMNAEGVRGYLAWRTRIAIAQRMDAVGAEAEFLMERDRVLAEAVRLLETNDTQAALFRAAGTGTGQTRTGNTGKQSGGPGGPG
jgi:carboxyl-terminal processing protease